MHLWELPYYPVITVNVLSYLDPLSLYKQYYIHNREMFNNSEALQILCCRYNITHPVNTFMKFLLEYDYKYKTSIICPLDNDQRALILLKRKDITMAEKYFFPSLLQKNMNLLEDIFLEVGKLGKIHLLSEQNKNALTIDQYAIGRMIASNWYELIPERKLGQETLTSAISVAPRGCFLTALAKINDIESINRYIALTGYSRYDIGSIILGAEAGKHLELIYHLLYMEQNSIEFAPISVNEDWKYYKNKIDYSKLTAFHFSQYPLEIALEAEKVINLDFEKIVTKCLEYNYNHNHNVFIYATSKLKNNELELFLPKAITSDNIHILKHLLDIIEPDDMTLRNFLIHSLIDKRFKSASFLWTQIRETKFLYDGSLLLPNNLLKEDFESIKEWIKYRKYF